MSFQSVFLRYEQKYLITEESAAALMSRIGGRLECDRYAHSDIRNVYYDTPDFRLIRDSIEKPIYKEKLRIRSYGRVTDDTEVFVELKRKYDGIVYKRRVAMKESEARLRLSGGCPFPSDTQIGREIGYFLSFYRELSPRLFLSYERDSYRDSEGAGVRITLDRRIRARREELTLSSEAYGAPLLSHGEVLMEIKCAGGMPLWLCCALSELGIYKTSFSKYGEAYKKHVVGVPTAENLTFT